MDDLQTRLDNHQLWLLQRAVRECREPERVRIVDTGRLGGIDGPRYRLEWV